MVNTARVPLHGEVEIDDTWVGGEQPGRQAAFFEKPVASCGTAADRIVWLVKASNSSTIGLSCRGVTRHATADANHS
jgi:hypothetical protein